LATDASATGLEAVLLQHGRPVMYVAHSLTGAETRYSTIEKELLAVVFAFRRCHLYNVWPACYDLDGSPLAVGLDGRGFGANDASFAPFCGKTVSL
jgi:hypothetical protein